MIECSGIDFVSRSIDVRTQTHIFREWPIESFWDELLVVQAIRSRCIGQEPQSNPIPPRRTARASKRIDEQLSKRIDEQLSKRID